MNMPKKICSTLLHRSSRHISFCSLQGTGTSDKNMFKDIFGVTFTGLVTAVGGGTLRDMIPEMRPTWVVNGKTAPPNNNHLT